MSGGEVRVHARQDTICSSMEIYMETFQTVAEERPPLLLRIRLSDFYRERYSPSPDFHSRRHSFISPRSLHHNYRWNLRSYLK